MAEFDVNDADRQWAQAYCAFRTLRYLSHERYGCELRIAVEASDGRFEIKINHPVSQYETAF